MEVNNVRERIGAELRALREECNLSVDEVAERAGLTKCNVVNIERGRYNVRFDTAEMIANVLGAKVKIVKNDE